MENSNIEALNYCAEAEFILPLVEPLVDDLNQEVLLILVLEDAESGIIK